MRIKSDFKDYYDCMARYDEDRATLFLRKSGRPTDTERAYMLPYSDRPWQSRFRYGSHLIAFCGIWYPLLHVHNGSKVTLAYEGSNWEPLIQVSKYPEMSIRRFFENYGGGKPAEKDLVEENGPIFMLSSPDNGKASLTKNPKLSSLGFAKILPPNIAYNELYKFVCNMQRPAMPIPEMSNDIKIHQAGFDLKTSFRTPKSKK